MIASIRWHPGVLFPGMGFIVTNPPMEPEWIVGLRFSRGVAEQHIKMADTTSACTAVVQAVPQ